MNSLRSTAMTMTATSIWKSINGGAGSKHSPWPAQQELVPSAPLHHLAFWRRGRPEAERRGTMKHKECPDKLQRLEMVRPRISTKNIRRAPPGITSGTNEDTPNTVTREVTQKGGGTWRILSRGSGSSCWQVFFMETGSVGSLLLVWACSAIWMSFIHVGIPRNLLAVATRCLSMP